MIPPYWGIPNLSHHFTCITDEVLVVDIRAGCVVDVLVPVGVDAVWFIHEIKLRVITITKLSINQIFFLFIFGHPSLNF